MSTLPPPDVEKFPENSLEKRIYNIVENMKDYLPVANDRNRLAFNLYKYVKGEGDNPEILVKTTKVQMINISEKELAAKLKSELEKIK